MIPDDFRQRESGPLRWPHEEASPYADWWLTVEGPQDADVADVGFGATVDGPVRQMPVWSWALPSGAARRGMATIVAPDQPFGEPLPPDAPPPVVLVVIDTAINPFHARLRSATGRPAVVAHWLMEGKWDGSPRVPFGCEIRRDQIEAWSGTEEDGLRHHGAHRLDHGAGPRETARTEAHGTGVMALALAADVPVLAVSLPSNRLMSGSGAFLEPFVDQAIRWALARLGEAFPGVPAIINLSYGLSAGPKDGSGWLAGQLRGMLASRGGLALMMPAGNDGLASVHAVLSAAPGHEAVAWRVQPSDPHAAYAEVWTTGLVAGVGLDVSGPGGLRLAVPDLSAMAPDLALEIASPGQGPLARVYPLPNGAVAGRRGVLIALAPTRRWDSGRATAPAGTWRIALTGAVPANATKVRADVHLQSERSDQPGSRTNPPSRLLPLGAVKPTRVGTLNAVAVGTGAEIVDAERMPRFRALETWWSSAGDPTYDPPFAPTQTVPADRSVMLNGLPTAGYRSGVAAAWQGTSFACAEATAAAIRAAMPLA